MERLEKASQQERIIQIRKSYKQGASLETQFKPSKRELMHMLELLGRILRV